MIGLDSNLILRYLLQDDPHQAVAATRIIESRLTEDNPGFISLVTMAEVVWVLQRYYELSSEDTANAVEGLLQADTLLIQNEKEVFAAVTVLKYGEGSFADALIGHLGAWAGCKATLTFDKRAARLPNFTLAT